jgi:exodeoxyribonuclease V alpha subunit
VLKVKVKGRRRLVSVVGHGFSIVAGEAIESIGVWNEHSEHGERFLAETMRTTLPHTANAAAKYLSSGLVRGIGPELAKRMVARFGAEVFEVIENLPDLLQDVSGIGLVRATSIRASWNEQKALRGIMDFLGVHGLSALLAPRIFRTFGSDAVSFIEKNPYRLAREVPCVGFKSADLIAQHFQLPMDSEERFACAIHDRLQCSIVRGHCAAPAEKLIRDVSREVGFPEAKVKSALESEIESGRLAEELIDDMGIELGIFPANLAAAEKRLALALARLAKGATPWRSTVFLDSPPRLLQRKSVKLSEKQRAALGLILSSKVSILTGGPGTGKTTLIRAVCETLTDLDWRVVCCAPTGRAAQRLTEMTGFEAQTIHRLLGWKSSDHGFRFRSDNRLYVDLLIVDEASMVGLELMDCLIQALPETTAVLLVGDQDQLPSVQAGRVLESIIDSRRFAHAHLKEIFRQENGHESLIVRYAQDILNGSTPPLLSKSPKQDFHFIEARDPERCTERILQLVKDRIPESFGLNSLNDIQVLCPMNKGLVGARALNRRLQDLLNPNPSDFVERFGQVLRVGDKVIVTVNDYDKDIFNGDIGRVTQIERERSSLRVDFNVRSVDFDFSELDSLALAFAISVHKAQGSEYEAVVIPLQEESAALLGRKLLYTAITRGKKLVVVVGSREALRLAIRAQPEFDRRWSGLAHRLRSESAMQPPASGPESATARSMAKLLDADN